MELEVRLKFADPALALKLLENRAKLVGEYETLDIYYQPKGVAWSFEDKNMRLRHAYSGADKGKTIFMYRELSWENGVKTHAIHWKYEVGDSLEAAEQVLKTWGMEEVIRYKKLGKRFNLGGTDVFYEDIEYAGILVEVEKDIPEELQSFVKEVFGGLDYQVVPKSVASVVSEAKNLFLSPL